MAENDTAVATADPTVDALKGLLDGHFERISTMVNDRLKAFEDAPALKSAGFITPDGGAADPEVKNFVDFLVACQRRDNKRLKSVYNTGWQDYSGEGIKALAEGSGAAGGYAVPVTYEREISRIAGLMAFFETLGYQVTMGADQHKFPMLNQTDNPSSSGVGTSGFYGGMYFTLESEGATIAERAPTFKQGNLLARKLAGLTTTSNELRADAPQVEQELMQIFAEGLAASKQALFLHGSGVGMPLGALHASNPALIGNTRVSSGNNIDIGDVTGLMSKMIPSLFGNAIFIAHPLALDNLMQLSLVTNGDPAFTPASNAAPGSPLIGSLVGKPVYADEFMAPPGTAGDLAFVAPKAYAVGTRGGILLAGSEHVNFASDQYTWRITTRIDGQPRIDGTIKLADGANTPVSGFVRIGT